MTRRRWMDAALAVSLLVLPTASYADDPADSLGGTGVTLYEMSERVTFDPDPSSPGVARRNATSPLQGFAELGTSTTRLTTSLLGESRWTAFTFFTFVSRPAILAFAPIPFVGLFAPLAPVVLLPARWRIATPFLPPGRRYSVIADRHLKDRGWNARGFDDRPWSVPALPEIPPATLERPILMAIEEDVLGRAGRVVDRHSWDDHEGGRSRQMNPDVDPHLRLGARDCCYDNRRQDNDYPNRHANHKRSSLLRVAHEPEQSHDRVRPKSVWGHCPCA
jgi:hypothetical protein